MLTQAVFLVGGRGSRLGPLTAKTPKPLLDVGGAPFLDCLIEQAARHGLRRVLLLCGPHAQTFADRYRHETPGGAEITVAAEPAGAGTGGALRHAAELLDERFFMANGDTFFDVNWLDLLTVPGADSSVACLALKQMETETARYGAIELDGARIARFEPSAENCAGPVNAGLYLVRKAIVERIGETPCSLEHEIFPALAGAGQLTGRVYERFFIDIGVPADFARAQTAIPQRRRRPIAILDAACLLRRGVPDAWRPGAPQWIKSLNDQGYRVILSPRPGHIADDWIKESLQAVGAHVDGLDSCEASNLAHRIANIAARQPIDQDGSFLLSDDPAYLRAAQTAGLAQCRSDSRSLARLAAGNSSAPSEAADAPQSGGPSP